MSYILLNRFCCNCIQFSRDNRPQTAASTSIISFLLFTCLSITFVLPCFHGINNTSVYHSFPITTLKSKRSKRRSSPLVFCRHCCTCSAVSVFILGYYQNQKWVCRGNATQGGKSVMHRMMEGEGMSESEWMNTRKNLFYLLFYNEDQHAALSAF